MLGHVPHTNIYASLVKKALAGSPAMSFRGSASLNCSTTVPGAAATLDVAA